MGERRRRRRRRRRSWVLIGKTTNDLEINNSSVRGWRLLLSGRTDGLSERRTISHAYVLERRKSHYDIYTATGREGMYIILDIFGLKVQSGNYFYGHHNTTFIAGGFSFN
jgi:hypothetical protein